MKKLVFLIAFVLIAASAFAQNNKSKGNSEQAKKESAGQQKKADGKDQTAGNSQVKKENHGQQKKADNQSQHKTDGNGQGKKEDGNKGNAAKKEGDDNDHDNNHPNADTLDHHKEKGKQEHGKHNDKGDKKEGE